VVVDIHYAVILPAYDEITVEGYRHECQGGDEYEGALEEGQAIAEPASPNPVAKVGIDRGEP